MADLIAFLIEHFQDFEACPPSNDLSVLLEEVGFDGAQIDYVLMLLELLTVEPQYSAKLYHEDSIRVYVPEELDVLPDDVLGLLHFLEKEGALNYEQREFVIHALLAIQPEDISVNMAKVLVLLVLWAHRSELPVLIGDELMMALHEHAVMN